MMQDIGRRPQRPASEDEGAPLGRASATHRALGPGNLAGTLCSDPEMRFVGSGKALVKLRVASTPRVLDDASGTWRDGETEFVDLVCWGRQGENVMESLRKGDRVVANGIWQETRWRGQDGEWHARRQLTVRDIGPSLMFRQVRVARREDEAS